VLTLDHEQLDELAAAMPEIAEKRAPGLGRRAPEFDRAPNRTRYFGWTTPKTTLEQGPEEADMAKIIANEWMTLDGVVQAPSDPDEDRDNGFSHGGWHTRYFDEVSQNWVLDSLRQASAFLFGRQTYESFAAHWPNAAEEEQPLARPLNSRPKYVVSTTFREPLSWEHSALLSGDAAQAVRALKDAVADPTSSEAPAWWRPLPLTISSTSTGS
jgi:dihydrofolate reductase